MLAYSLLSKHDINQDILQTVNRYINCDSSSGYSAKNRSLVYLLVLVLLFWTSRCVGYAGNKIESLLWIHRWLKGNTQPLPNPSYRYMYIFTYIHRYISIYIHIHIPTCNFIHIHTSQGFSTSALVTSLGARLLSAEETILTLWYP